MKILVPPTEVIEDFQHKFDIFNDQIEANTIEIQRLYELQSVLLAKLASVSYTHLDVYKRQENSKNNSQSNTESGSDGKESGESHSRYLSLIHI